MIVMQSMERKEYYLKIAEKVYPELNSGRFFANVKGIEHYFSGLLSMEVKSIYKSFYDEFDFAFSVQCTFSLCDQKSDLRWIRKEGREHSYMTPVVFVVERSEMNYPPAQIMNRMLSRYRANTIILESYNYGHYNEQHLAEYMRQTGLQVIWKRELDFETETRQSLLNHVPRIRRLNSEMIMASLTLAT
ncbi:hypothetical protein BH11BAC1_BH11BAC1_22670 [soil metagenome]